MQDDNSPVSVVQNGLDGIATTSRDVPLKTREQGQKHIDSEALALSEEERGKRCDCTQSITPLVGLKACPYFHPLASPPYLWALRILSTISSPTLFRTVRPSEQLMKN